MTNLEQLRKMSDEELITFLSNIYSDMDTNFGFAREVAESWCAQCPKLALCKETGNCELPDHDRREEVQVWAQSKAREVHNVEG